MQHLADSRDDLLNKKDRLGINSYGVLPSAFSKARNTSRSRLTPPVKLQAASGNVSSTQWKPEKIGFFDPQLALTAGQGSMIRKRVTKDIFRCGISHTGLVIETHILPFFPEPC